MHTRYARARRRRLSVSSRLLWAPLAVFFILILSACTGRFVANGWSGLAFTTDSLVVGTADGRVVALDPGGQLRWEFSREDDDALGPVYGAPAIAHGLAYVGGFSGNVYALDLRNGEPVWQAETGGSVVAGATVAGETLLVGSSDGKLYAFDALEGGNPLWTFPEGDGAGEIWSSPVVHQGMVYFGSLDHRVYAVSLETGQLAWPEPFETGGAVTARPLVHNGRVYVGSFDGRLYALDAATGQAEASIAAESWFWAGAVTDGELVYAANLDGNLYAWDGTSPEPAWRFSTNAAMVVPPELIGTDRIAAATDDGRVFVLDRQTREVQWTFPVDSPVRARLVTSGDVLYVSTLERTVHALNVAEMRQIWQERMES